MIIFLWKQHCEMTSENKKRSRVRDESQGKVSWARRRWWGRLWSPVDEFGELRHKSSGARRVRVNWQNPARHRAPGREKQPWFPPKHLSQRFSLTRLQPQSQPMCHLTSQASSPESFCKTDAFSVPEDFFGTFPKSAISS